MAPTAWVPLTGTKLCSTPASLDIPWHLQGQLMNFLQANAVAASLNGKQRVILEIVSCYLVKLELQRRPEERLHTHS